MSSSSRSAKHAQTTPLRRRSRTGIGPVGSNDRKKIVGTPGHEARLGKLRWNAEAPGHRACGNTCVSSRLDVDVRVAHQDRLPHITPDVIEDPIQTGRIGLLGRKVVTAQHGFKRISKSQPGQNLLGKRAGLVREYGQSFPRAPHLVHDSLEARIYAGVIEAVPRVVALKCTRHFIDPRVRIVRACCAQASTDEHAQTVADESFDGLGRKR